MRTATRLQDLRGVGETAGLASSPLGRSVKLIVNPSFAYREAETDRESTFYPSIPDETPDKDYWCRESHFDTGLAAYGDETVPWCDKVVLYLKDCGVTDAEIAAFRAIMLGGSK